MDLEKLKNSVQNVVMEEDQDEELRNVILSDMITMYKLMKSFEEIWRKKMKNSVDEFLTKVKSVLEENDFQISRADMTEDMPEGTILTGTYQSATVEIKNINYRGKLMEFTTGAGQITHFFFGTPKDVPNYYLWREHVDICGTKLCTLTEDPEAVFHHFVQPETCMDELYVIKDEIAGNLNHYKRGILDAEFVTLQLYNRDKKCFYHSFKEFWDNL